jgi:YD repeat-containing protein
VLDALGQTKEYSYALDDRLIGTTYVDAVNTTPNVSFTYDPYYPRLTSMTDGTGTTIYSYGSVGSLGALQLAAEAGPLTDSTISYAYDELGRMGSHTIQGAGAKTFAYDALGHLANHASDLGAFTLAYLRQTGQITSRELASNTLGTTWSYLTNTNDRRLSEIESVGLTAGQHSTYDYTTTPENFITGIAETSDTATVYSAAFTQTVTYNNLNQITDLSGHSLTWDDDGNLLSDGTRTYT